MRPCTQHPRVRDCTDVLLSWLARWVSKNQIAREGLPLPPFFLPPLASFSHLPCTYAIITPQRHFNRAQSPKHCQSQGTTPSVLLLVTPSWSPPPLPAPPPPLLLLFVPSPPPSPPPVLFLSPHKHCTHPCSPPPLPPTGRFRLYEDRYLKLTPTQLKVKCYFFPIRPGTTIPLKDIQKVRKGKRERNTWKKRGTRSWRWQRMLCICTHPPSHPFPFPLPPIPSDLPPTTGQHVERPVQVLGHGRRLSTLVAQRFETRGQGKEGWKEKRREGRKEGRREK